MDRSTRLGPGQKSRDRGSTFATSRSELGRSAPAAARAARRRAAVSPASEPQKQRARTEPCIVTEQEALYGATVDPAHLWPRGRGGCDSALCVVPLIRELHRPFDDGEFDLLPYLTARHVPELQHALGHAGGDLIALLQRLTGQRYAPAVGG